MGLKSYRFLSLIFLVADYLAIICAEYVAMVLRDFLVGGSKYAQTAVLQVDKTHFWLLIPLVYIVVLQIEHLYSRKGQYWQILQSIAHACVYATLTIVLILYTAKMSAMTSRPFILLLGLLVFIFVSLMRYVLKKIFEHLEIMQIPVLIIGAGKVAQRLVEGISHDAGMGYKIVGFLEDKPEEKKLLQKYPLLGGFDDAEKVITELGINNVMICAPKMYRDKLNGLVYRIQPLVRNLSIIPNLVDVPMCGVEVETFFAERMMALRMRNNLLLWHNRLLKTLLDYLCTIVGIILLSPIFLLVAFLIYQEDPGPIFYKHMRVGKNGKVFPCYKFRSMCVNSQERLEELLRNDENARQEWESSFKLKNDPRITKIGGKLRRTSLDELPQLFNVLRGEMSLVGPRPVIQKELDEFYKENAELYKMVKPGITGMWQVSGRSDVDYDERIVMDNWYICNWSVWLDIMLLWRTVKVVLGGKGAY